MQMTFHAHVLSAIVMRFWNVACVLNGHALYTIFIIPTPHFLALSVHTNKVSYIRTNLLTYNAPVLLNTDCSIRVYKFQFTYHALIS